MRSAGINHAFLDAVVTGAATDVYYHLGLSSDDPVLEPMREVRAVIMAGSAERVTGFAHRWSDLHGGTPIVALPKEDRFVTRYTAGVLFASHGMGMPSASIALQELMRLVFFLKRGDLEALDSVFWARVGTSGGVGLPAGAVVVSTEGLMADLRPYRLLRGGTGEYRFDGTFPAGVRAEILAACGDPGYPVVSGATVAGNDFFLEQYRLDGAICLETPDSKMEWLRWLAARDVKNIEMEGAMFAGYLNHWGFPRFAMICCTLLDRLEGDQVTASQAELQGFSERAGDVLFDFLYASLGTPGLLPGEGPHRD